MNRQRAINQQKGFGIFFAILVLALIAGASLVSWRIHDTQNRELQREADNAPVVATATVDYMDTAKKFSFSYPADWQTAYPAGGSDGGQSAPDWNTVSRPVMVVPANGHKDNSILVMPGCGADGIAKAKSRADKFHHQVETKVNGYPALYDSVQFKNGDAEQYNDNIYTIVNGGHRIEIRYRLSWKHPMSNTDFDDSKNSPGFNTVVRSIKFL